jgi:hypothetical protein
MINHELQKPATIEDSSPTLPAIIIPIPARYIKSRNKSQDWDIKDKNDTNETRPQTRKSTTNETIVPAKLHISPVILRKTLKHKNQLRKTSAGLSFSMIENKNKKKVVKCDLKKGIFSSKQNVFMENTSKVNEGIGRNSISPIAKVFVQRMQEFGLVSNLKGWKENLEDRRKNWRTAMREFGGMS